MQGVEGRAEAVRSKAIKRIDMIHKKFWRKNEDLFVFEAPFHKNILIVKRLGPVL